MTSCLRTYFFEPRQLVRTYALFRSASSSDVDNGFSEGTGSFLRQVVPDAAGDGPVLILAREFLRINTGIRVRCAVRIAFESDSRHPDDRKFGELLFQGVILRLAIRETESPAVVMDHDADVVRVVEGRGAAIERGLVKVPLRRGELPNEPRELAPIFFVAGAAAFR